MSTPNSQEKRPLWEGLLKRAFVFLFGQTIRRGLRGVWLRGQWPQAPVILASNHHSWWDSYLLPYLGIRQKPGFSVMVGEARLKEFGFFAQMGAVSASRPKASLAALKRGERLLVFPEGTLGPPDSVAELQPGIVWLAQKAKVKIAPVAARVVLRGHEFPEAYVVLGEPMEPDLENLRMALNQMLSGLDEQIRTAPAEAALPGFRLEIAGRKSTHERMAVWAALLQKLTGSKG